MKERREEREGKTRIATTFVSSLTTEERRKESKRRRRKENCRVSTAASSIQKEK